MEAFENLEHVEAISQLAEDSMRAFLLAGERFIHSGFRRANTEESRFAQFYESLTEENQALMRGYFKRQVLLSLQQRQKLLGEYTEIAITDPLDFATKMELYRRKPAKFAMVEKMVMDLSSVDDQDKDVEEAALQITARSATANGHHTKMQLKLDELHINKAQDRERWWDRRRKVRLTDETCLSVMVVDETGQVKTYTHKLGQIWEGKSKRFNGKTMATVNLTEGGNNFPKPYFFYITAVELDNNSSYNDFIKKATEYAAEAVTEELVQAGVIKSGESSEDNTTVLDPALALLVAAAIKKLVEVIINWFGNLASDKDDVLSTEDRKVIVHNYNAQQDQNFTIKFKGRKKGEWTAKMRIVRTKAA